MASSGGVGQCAVVVQVPPPRSGLAVFRFPAEVILLTVRSAVRWYLRHGLSYREVEELLAERGIMVDHITVYRVCPRMKTLTLGQSIVFTFDIKAFLLAQHPVRCAAEDLPLSPTHPLEEFS